jgi:hypothetical protein
MVVKQRRIILFDDVGTISDDKNYYEKFLILGLIKKYLIDNENGAWLVRVELIKHQIISSLQKSPFGSVTTTLQDL